MVNVNAHTMCQWHNVRMQYSYNTASQTILPHNYEGPHSLLWVVHVVLPDPTMLFTREPFQHGHKPWFHESLWLHFTMLQHIAAPFFGHCVGLGVWTVMIWCIIVKRLLCIPFFTLYLWVFPILRANKVLITNSRILTLKPVLTPSFGTCIWTMIIWI